MRLDHLLSKENYLLFDFESSLKFSKINKYFKQDRSILLKKYFLVKYGGVAQLGEHLPCKQGVRGSTPLISTICTLKTEYISDKQDIK